MDITAQDLTQPVIPQPPIEPVVPIIPIVPPPKSPVSALVLSALLLTALVLAGYLYWQNTQLKSQLTAAPSPSLVGTADPTANWQTYTNSQFGYPNEIYSGYSLKFPSPQCDQVYSTLDCHLTHGTFTLIIDAGGHGGDTDPSEILTNGEIKSIAAGEGKLTIIKKLTTNKLIGYYWINKTVKLSQEPIIGFEFMNVPAEDQEEFEQLFDQILSTFKFTDTTKTSTNTCASTNLGLSLTLPSKDWTCKADENLDPQQNGADGTISLKSAIFTVLISSFGRGPFCELSDPDPESPRYDPTNTCSISEFYTKNNMKLQTYKLNDQTKEIFGQIGNGPSVAITYTGMENRDLSVNEKLEIISILDSIKSVK